MRIESPHLQAIEAWPLVKMTMPQALGTAFRPLAAWSSSPRAGGALWAGRTPNDQLVGLSFPWHRQGRVLMLGNLTQVRTNILLLDGSLPVSEGASQCAIVELLRALNWHAELINLCAFPDHCLGASHGHADV